MATKIIKGRMFGVTMTTSDEHLKKLRKAPELAAEAYESAAVWWHTGLLPDHFTRQAHAKYGYAERCKSYLKTKGANPDLVRTGSMRLELLAKAALKKRGVGVELKLTARGLNFVPNSANPLDIRMRRNDGKMYPNMKREVSEITAEESAAITKMVQAKLVALFSE